MVSLTPVLGTVGCWLALTCSLAAAGGADVVAVKIAKTAPGLYRFEVTVRHQDSGWEHYANRWAVVAPDGTILGVRELLHPHDEEQPFTRSLAGVAIADELASVTVRANDLVHGFGGREMTLALPNMAKE